MATSTQDIIKQGTVHEAADRLAALREETQQEAFETEETPEIVDDLDDPEIETELEAEEAPETSDTSEEPETDEEPDIFADDLDEAPRDTLDAPAAFSKEGKELFTQADPKLQQEFSTRLKDVERGARQKVEQANQKAQELEAQAEQILQMREELQSRLENLGPSLPEPPDENLANPDSDSYDPDRFNVEFARYERAKRDVEKTQSERQKVAEENQKVQAEKERALRQQHAAQIVKDFPKWNTQESFSKGVSTVHDYFVAQGTPREVATKITDPVAIRLGYKAMRYDEIKSQARGGKTAPKTAAPTGKPKTQKVTNIRKAAQAHSESKSVRSAAALLREQRTANRR